MQSNGCLLCKVTFVLVSSTLTHPAFSALFKPHDPSTWPQPPCKMYYPVDDLYTATCPNIEARVCGSNGLTYKNECFFCLDQWEFGAYVQFVKYGDCS
uniref:Serine peptidase inhibitor Kazal type 13 n=2 Tax=Marmota marmota marmota TaxID=9994 RepID=A0A8C5ZZ87_MARMA